jgi:two-component system, NarL family, response regulator NreC
MRPRTILADDHRMVAEGLGKLIGEVAVLVDQVENGRDLVVSVRRNRPDIVVSDVSMPLMSGLEALRQLRAEGCSVRFIFVTIHTDGRLAAEAIKSGANGFIPKQAAGEELLDAMRAVMAGRTYISPRVAKDVVIAASEGGGKETGQLTIRQLEVLRLIGEGKRMKEIAAELCISVRTVEDHKSQLKQLLGAGTTTELVKFAMKKGIVSG